MCFNNKNETPLGPIYGNNTEWNATYNIVKYVTQEMYLIAFHDILAEKSKQSNSSLVFG